MKKILIPLLAGLLAVTSCNLDGEFKAENVQDLIIPKSTTILMNDYGVEYTIKDDQSDHGWQVGNRYLIIFDVLNSNYDITLKDYVECFIIKPEPAPEEAPEWNDPVQVDAASISGGYVNLTITYNEAKNSDYLHRMIMQYKNDNSGNLDLILYHDGNHESVVEMEASAVNTVTRLYSFPLPGLAPSGESRTLFLSVHEVDYDASGKKIVKQNRYRLYDSPIQF